MGLETDGAEVVAGGEADIGVKGSRQAPHQGNGGLGAAFFDALDLVCGHADALGEVGDAKAKGDPPVIDRLPNGLGLADRDPLRVIGRGFSARPAGVGAAHHTCLS